MKVLVAYDGTLQAKDALRYGAAKVKENGGELLALHVFDSNIFIGYDSHPRAKEMAKAESDAFVDKAIKIMRAEGKGVKASITVAEGDPEKEIIDFAKEERVDVLLCPPKYKSIISRYKRALRAEGKNPVEDAVLDETEKLKMAVVTTK